MNTTSDERLPFRNDVSWHFGKPRVFLTPILRCREVYVVYVSALCITSASALPSRH